MTSSGRSFAGWALREGGDKVFSSILGFDPMDVLLPETQRYDDDDYLIEYEERRNRGHADDYDEE